MRPIEDWKSEEMVRAEYGLDDAAERAYRDMYAAGDVLDEIAPNDERRAAEHAEACWEYAHREDVAPAWKAVIAKVEAGELSWHDVAGGDAVDDPAVRAAIAADNLLRERREPEGTGAAPARAAADEDAYYDQFTVYRKSSSDRSR